MVTESREDPMWSDDNRHREALELILRVATTSDLAGTTLSSSGEPVPLWSVSGKDRALGEVVRIARAALDH